MSQILVYAGLFLASFAAATILPVQSEIPFTGFLLTEHYDQWLLVGVASVGNTLGSVLNWVLGGFIGRLESQRWFPVSRQSIARAETWYH